MTGFQFYRLATYDRYRQHNSCSLYQQTGWDPFPYHVTSSSGSVPISGHSHSGQTHSRLSKPDSGPPILVEPAHNNRVGSPPRNRDVGTPTVNMLATVHNTHLPQFRSPILEPQAWSPLLSKVIQKPRTTQEGEVILIAPWWPHNCSFHIYYVFV